MHHRLHLALVVALGGCATAAPPAPSTTAAAIASDRAAALDEARQVTRTQRERISELEAQLGLVRASNRELRDELRALREREARRVTRLGAAPSTPSRATPAVTPEVDEPRPVLRLYGSSSRPALSVDGVRAIAGPAAPPVLAAPPVGGVSLPVVGGSATSPHAAVPAIPTAPVRVAPGSFAPATFEVTQTRPPRRTRSVPAADGAAEEYRAALRHLSERRLAEASAGLERFLARHADHPYADNALFWQGEILFTQRRYRQALGVFSRLTERYPNGNKVPDALLRVGQCHRRMGDRARAERALTRLRARYPNSVAARIASQEDA